MSAPDPALEAAMDLAGRRRGLPPTLASIYTAWNLCFRAFCKKHDHPWPDHRSVPPFIDYLRDETDVNRDEIVHAVDALIFGLEETSGLAAPLATALRARVLSDVPLPESDVPARSDGAQRDADAPRQAALTRVMVAMDAEAKGSFGQRFGSKTR